MEAILHELPVLPGMINYVRGAADAITMIGVSTQLGILNLEGDLSLNHQRRDDPAAIRELDRLASHLDATLNALNGLSFEAYRELYSKELTCDREEPARRSGFGYVEDFPNRPNPIIIDLLGRIIQAKANLEMKTLRARAGRPKNILATATAIQALVCFERLTGKRATVTTDPVARGHPRSGEFVQLMTSLFPVLHINASAVAQALLAIKKSDEHRDLYSHARTRLEDAIRRFDCWELSRKAGGEAAP